MVNNYMYGEETANLIKHDAVKNKIKSSLENDFETLYEISKSIFCCSSINYPCLAFKSEQHRTFVLNIIKEKIIDLQTSINQLNGDYD